MSDEWKDPVTGAYLARDLDGDYDLTLKCGPYTYSVLLRMLPIGLEVSGVRLGEAGEELDGPVISYPRLRSPPLCEGFDGRTIAFWACHYLLVMPFEPAKNRICESGIKSWYPPGGEL